MGPLLSAQQTSARAAAITTHSMLFLILVMRLTTSLNQSISSRTSMVQMILVAAVVLDIRTARPTVETVMIRKQNLTTGAAQSNLLRIHRFGTHAENWNLPEPDVGNLQTDL